MDFYRIATRVTKKGVAEVYPVFVIGKSEDLMVRGKSFYAVWDEDSGFWSTDEYLVQKIVDRDLWDYKERLEAEGRFDHVEIRTMRDYDSRSWVNWQEYLKHLSDNVHLLDSKVIFANTETKKTDYASKRLPYAIGSGEIDAYDELMSTLYSPEERKKIEWAIGGIIAGDSPHIDKFIVFYGEPGTGKSTVISIIQKLFDGYFTVFDAASITSNNNAFSTEVFKDNPLVAIQHDGDLSKIDDNSKLNSVVSHEMMLINEKYKPGYVSRINCFLFMGTNKPVKITDSRSGIIRRLIDVYPTGNRLPIDKYFSIMDRIDFELGAIADHCLNVYRKMGKNYYASYRPVGMMFKTDIFFNFIEENYLFFSEEDGVTLKQAYDMYKAYCDESLIDHKLPRYKFKEELKSYFSSYDERVRVNGESKRSWYSGFISDKLYSDKDIEIPSATWLHMDKTESIFDKEYADCIAQYAKEDGTPYKRWSSVKTTLSDIDTWQVHYVKVPDNHIVIDFDLKDENGEKSKSLNLEAAAKWPPTYAEFSKSGNGIHLHYNYAGDVSKLSRLYSDGIEIKVFTGKSSLRRRLSSCNDIPVATISSGLPLKKEKMINKNAVTNEKSIRAMIEKNLRKEVHPGTKPSIDFIYKILEDAYSSGVPYDVSDMYNKVLTFAMHSTNQAKYCVNLVSKMHFASESNSEPEEADGEIVFFDVEVFPNLFLVNWKKQGEGNTVVRMINPSPSDIAKLMDMKLVGFNNRRYDNHILYARYLGYTNEQLYKLSQKIISGNHRAFFGEAYNISYADIYDFSSKKQSLKKFEIELGIHHQELGLPWDQPVPEEKWVEVAEYCDNDVLATEATFNARKADFVAREIISAISGLSVNSTTRQHAAKIIFGDDPEPQKKFVYTDLSKMFPGYKYENGVSTYRGEEVGEGGYVYAEPGMYGHVALLDIASMHPTSIECLNLFGPYTEKFSEIKQARIAIKHGDIDQARKMLGGALSGYLDDPSIYDDLAYALKIVINSIYGFTAAKFENKFRDIRNIDNIVAKRGALFMINLKHEVQERGYKVAHIKTDSIKIPDATPEIIDFVMRYGNKFGYTFEHEATYDRMCLVNNAVYIARYADGKHAGEWTATGAQFAQPYVYKTLFSHEDITFKDMCETRTVTSSLYLDMNEGLQEGEHNYIFVGRAGEFSPIQSGHGGGILLREKDGKYYSASDSKGYRWLESEMVEKLGLEKYIDKTYYDSMVDDAIASISEYGDFEWFVSDDVYVPEEHIDIPWQTACQCSGHGCGGCDMRKDDICTLGYNIERKEIQNG